MKKNRNINNEDKNKNILPNNEKLNIDHSNRNCLYISLIVFIPIIIALIIYYFFYKKKFISENEEENEKYFFQNGEYYIGQLKNKLPNGKGKQYDSKGTLRYYGDWVNGKYEGNGTYYLEDGSLLYIGQFKMV